MLCISPLYAKAYNISQFDMGSATYGHSQAVLFTPNSRNKDLLPFLFINLYLATGSRDGVGDDQRKIAQLAPLLRLPSGIRTFMCGDFNFIENVTDTTSVNPKSLFLSGHARNVWHRVLDHFDLHEISQPIHSFIRTSSDCDLVYSTDGTSVFRKATF